MSFISDDEQRLLDRIANDRFASDAGLPDQACRQCWNAGSMHVAEIVIAWIEERCLERKQRLVCEQMDAVAVGLAEIEEVTR